LVGQDGLEAVAVVVGEGQFTLTGRYRIALPDALRDRGGYRELNTTPAVAA